MHRGEAGLPAVWFPVIHTSLLRPCPSVVFRVAWEVKLSQGLVNETQRHEGVWGWKHGSEVRYLDTEWRRLASYTLRLFMWPVMFQSLSGSYRVQEVSYTWWESNHCLPFHSHSLCQHEKSRNKSQSQLRPIGIAIFAVFSVPIDKCQTGQKYRHWAPPWISFATCNSL
jgi:hypothetical protein